MRILKEIPFLVIVLFPLYSFCQDSTFHDSIERTRFFIGIDFSIIPFSFDNHAFDIIKFNSPIQYSNSLYFNIRTQNRFNSYTIIKTGLLTDVLNTNILLSKSTDDNTIEQIDILFRKRYIGIPILIGHSAHLSSHYCFVFQMGLVFFHEIGNKSSYQGTGNWEQAINNWKNKIDDEKGWNASMLYFSYGHEREINQVLLLHYELYWQHRFNENGFYNEETHRPFRPYDIIGINIGISWAPNI